MPGDQWRQPEKGAAEPGAAGVSVVPNPKLKLMDQVREVMRLQHYSIGTERCYCDWIRRYIRFHKMLSRGDLGGGEGKVEVFLSDLAVNGHVAASTQNQGFNALLFLWIGLFARGSGSEIPRGSAGVGMAVCVPRP